MIKCNLKLILQKILIKIHWPINQKRNFRIKISINISDLYIIYNILRRFGIRSKYLYICIIFYGLHRQNVFRNRTSASLFPGETTGALVYKARLSILARIWPKNGRFPMILEWIFFISCQGAAKCLRFAPKGLLCFKRLCMSKLLCVPPSCFLSDCAILLFQSATLFLMEESEWIIYTCIADVQKTHKQYKKSLIIYTILGCQTTRTCLSTTIFVQKKYFLIYRGLAPSRPKKLCKSQRFNVKRGQNAAIYNFSFLPHTFSSKCKNV